MCGMVVCYSCSWVVCCWHHPSNLPGQSGSALALKVRAKLPTGCCHLFPTLPKQLLWDHTHYGASTLHCCLPVDGCGCDPSFMGKFGSHSTCQARTKRSVVSTQCRWLVICGTGTAFWYLAVLRPSSCGAAAICGWCGVALWFVLGCYSLLIHAVACACLPA